ncbi:MAG: pyridoxamine 5-phosphate oxidase [Cyanobacteriota bacterium]|jgi:pyridoxamine 5'-phosphate oxidase
MSLAGNSNLIKTNWKKPPADPMVLMQDWVKQAQLAGITEPLGMTLTTVNQAGWAWNRVVLVKEFNPASIIFGSSSNSDKGQDIKHDARVAGNFWWRESVQQIHFRGYAAIVSSSKSDFLWQTRSRSAQAIAICSQQSQLLKSELDFQTEVGALEHSDKILLRPFGWNAYQITPIEYEFWQGDASRLHKRLRYSLQVPHVDFPQPSDLTESVIQSAIWTQQRLQP